MARKKQKKETYTFITASAPAEFKARLKEAARGASMLYEENEQGFDLGVSRGGHSGGYWYVATLTEQDGQTAMSGRIIYRSFHSNGEYREDTRWEKIKEWVGVAAIVVFFFPVILIALAVWGIMLLIGKLRGKPMPPTMTDGEKLTYFMTETMGCWEGK